MYNLIKWACIIILFYVLNYFNVNGGIILGITTIAVIIKIFSDPFDWDPKF